MTPFTKECSLQIMLQELSMVPLMSCDGFPHKQSGFNGLFQRSSMQTAIKGLGMCLVVDPAFNVTAWLVRLVASQVQLH